MGIPASISDISSLFTHFLFNYFYFFNYGLQE